MCESIYAMGATFVEGRSWGSDPTEVLDSVQVLVRAEGAFQLLGP